MKRIIFMCGIAFCTFMFLTSALAQQAPGAPGASGQSAGPGMGMGMGMGNGMDMSNMQMMCMPMMQQMVGHALLADDIMQIMKETLEIEQKIVQGVTAKERKALTSEIQKKIARIDQMKMQLRNMMMKPATPGPSSGTDQPGTGPKPEMTPKADPHGH
jgi:hypothetical protein